MYYNVASRLAVSTSAVQYSQAVSMAGANAILVDATAFSVSGTNVSISAEVGNDLENWSTLSGTLALTGPSYGTLKVGSVAGQYVRLKYEQTGGSVSVVSAGINTAQL